MEEEFLLSRYSNMDYILDMEINHYVDFLKAARNQYYNEREYFRWVNSGASTEMSLDDFRLKLQGKETNAERKKRLQSLDI